MCKTEWIMEPSADEVKVTSQEKKVLELMAAGKTCNQMAEDMGLTVQTIKWYRMRLREKFNAATSSELIHKAGAHGLL